MEQAILDGTLKLGDADAIHKLPEQKSKEAVEDVKSGKSRTAKRAGVRPEGAGRAGRWSLAVCLRAALLALFDLTDRWLDRVLAHDPLRVVVIENGRR